MFVYISPFNIGLVHQMNGPLSKNTQLYFKVHITDNVSLNGPKIPIDHLNRILEFNGGKRPNIYFINRLQNSPYFCVFKYARAIKQKVCNETENRERDWGEVFFSLASHAHTSSEARAVRARKTLTTRFTDLFTDFKKKRPTILQSILSRKKEGRLANW